jgi:hypothetical protein
MLTLIVMSAASVNAQVRIGGLDDPNSSAVLDLNATDATDNGTLGLALPRVALTSTSEAVKKGMIVYNTATAGDVTPGMYYNDGEKWIRVGNGTLTFDSDGDLTIVSPMAGDESYTFGIAAGGVTAAKLNAMGATSGQVLMYNGSIWEPVTLSPSLVYNCSGAIVYGGDYSGPEAGVPIPNDDIIGSFSAGWTHSNFIAQNKHLCWAAVDVFDTSATWQNRKTACEDFSADNSQWRFPNLKELQVLFELLGGTDSATPAGFEGLGSAVGTNKAADAMVNNGSYYWSSTDTGGSYPVLFRWSDGHRGRTGKDGAYGRVRCVRSL